MEGRIVFINHSRGMYCVELTDGSYSVFELLDINDINQDDIIQGRLDELGSCTLYNQTAGQRFDAFIEDTGSSLLNSQSDLINTSFKF